MTIIVITFTLPPCSKQVVRTPRQLVPGAVQQHTARIAAILKCGKHDMWGRRRNALPSTRHMYVRGLEWSKKKFFYYLFIYFFFLFADDTTYSLRHTRLNIKPYDYYDFHPSVTMSVTTREHQHGNYLLLYLSTPLLLYRLSYSYKVQR